MAPGKVRRFDSEYEREDMAYVHMAFEPLRGWREVEVSERHRGLEFAQLMHHLAEEIYPDAEKIRLGYATTFLLTHRRPSTKPSQRRLLTT